LHYSYLQNDKRNIEQQLLVLLLTQVELCQLPERPLSFFILTNFINFCPTIQNQNRTVNKEKVFPFIRMMKDQACILLSMYNDFAFWQYKYFVNYSIYPLRSLDDSLVFNDGFQGKIHIHLVSFTSTTYWDTHLRAYKSQTLGIGSNHTNKEKNQHVWWVSQ